MADLDILRAALVAGGVARVYEFGGVVPKPTCPYAVISLDPSAPQVRDLGGSGDPVGRFTVQHFGKTADSVGDIAAITFATFDGKALALSGEPVAWQEVATGLMRDPDDRGVLGVVHTYRF